MRLIVAADINVVSGRSEELGYQVPSSPVRQSVFEDNSIIEQNLRRAAYLKCYNDGNHGCGRTCKRLLAMAHTIMQLPRQRICGSQSRSSHRRRHRFTTASERDTNVGRFRGQASHLSYIPVSRSTALSCDCNDVETE